MPEGNDVLTELRRSAIFDRLERLREAALVAQVRRGTVVGRAEREYSCSSMLFARKIYSPANGSHFCSCTWLSLVIDVCHLYKSEYSFSSPASYLLPDHRYAASCAGKPGCSGCCRLAPAADCRRGRSRRPARPRPEEEAVARLLAQLNSSDAFVVKEGVCAMQAAAEGVRSPRSPKVYTWLLVAMRHKRPAPPPAASVSPCERAQS